MELLPSAPLGRSWTYWEVRRVNAEFELVHWKEVAVQLASDISTLEDLALVLNRVPSLTTAFGSYRITRDDERPGREGSKISTAAEAYALFRTGVPYDASFRVPGTDEKLVKARLRATLQPGPLDGIAEAWTTLVQLTAGHAVDPAEYVIGVSVQQKTRGRLLNYRFEIWLSTADPGVQAAVAGEISSAIPALKFTEWES